MLNTVANFSAFGIIEPVNCTDQISGDAADSFKAEAFFAFKFASSAARAMIPDNAVVSANRIPVDRVVDGTISDTLLAHEADDFFEGFQIGSCIPVHFHIGNMTGICQRMIRRFETDFVID